MKKKELPANSYEKIKGSSIYCLGSTVKYFVHALVDIIITANLDAHLVHQPIPGISIKDSLLQDEAT